MNPFTQEIMDLVNVKGQSTCSSSPVVLNLARHRDYFPESG